MTDKQVERSAEAAEHAEESPTPTLAGVPIDSYIPKAGDAIGLSHYINTHLESIWRLAHNFAKSGAVPTALRNKTADVFTVLCTGLELGVGYATALRTIHVVEGRACLSAGLIYGLAMKAGARFHTVERSENRCIIEWTRGESSGRVEFGVEDARRAGLLGKANWKTWGPDMLFARCSSRAAREAAGDILAGLYSTEEMQDVAALNHKPAPASPPVQEVSRARAPQDRPQVAAPEVQKEREDRDDNARKALMATARDLGIVDKVKVGDEERTVLLVMGDDIAGAIRMSGCGGQVKPSISGGAPFIVVRDLKTPEKSALAAQLRKTLAERRREAMDSRALDDAAEMLKGGE